MVRTPIAVTVACAGTLLLGACAGAGSESQPDGTVTVALPEDPASLDPATSAAAVERNVLRQIYDCLVRVDDQLQPRPGALTERFEASKDGRNYTFTLHRGITFHNGEPFNAQAVKAHFDRLRDRDVGSPYWEDYQSVGLEAVRVVDDRTVRMELTRPSPLFLSILADPQGGGIEAPKAARESGRDFRTKPVGTGPYKLESWQRGDAIRLVRNDDARSAAPSRAASVLFRGFADSNSALTQFLSGQVDVIARLSPRGSAQVEGGGDRVISQPGIETVRVFFNATRAPFDDERTRQAVSAALDREAVRKTVMGDAAVTAGQALAPVGVYENTRRPVPARDVAKARALLAAAGKPNGFAFTMLTYADNQEHARAAQLIASQLKEVGIDVRIEPVQLSALLERISPAGGRNYDATLLGGGAGNPDPVTWLYTNFGEEGSSQFGAARTPTMERSFQTALSTPDVDRRIQELQVVNAEIERIASQTTLWFYNSLVAAKSGVRGLSLSPTGILDLRGVTG